MKYTGPAEQVPTDKMLASMALIFVLMAVFFFFTGSLDAVDGRVHTKAGDVLRSQSPELFWKLVRRSYGFCAAMLGVAVVCALGARALKAKA